jgi:hypothetical protein
MCKIFRKLQQQGMRFWEHELSIQYLSCSDTGKYAFQKSRIFECYHLLIPRVPVGYNLTEPTLD